LALKAERNAAKSKRSEMEFYLAGADLSPGTQADEDHRHGEDGGLDPVQR
jgi:hypothetical protein